MNTEFDFDKISFLDGGWIFGEWWVMTTDFIDWDGGGEGQSLEGGLFVVNFVELFVDQVITENAKINDFWSHSDFFDQFSQDLWDKIKKIPLAIFAEIWYFSMTPGVLRVYSSSLSICIASIQQKKILLFYYNGKK